MNEWQKRVVEEQKQLREKILKLVAFLSSDPEPELLQYDRELLMRQLHIMRRYDAVLDIRIVRIERFAE